MAQALHVAKHQRDTISLWQPANLLVDHRSQFDLHITFVHVHRSSRRTTLHGPPPGPLDPLLVGNLERHTVKPIREQIGVPKRISLLHEDQKGGLERIFRRMFVAQYATAHAQYHGAMPMNQGPEGRFAPLLAG